MLDRNAPTRHQPCEPDRVFTSEAAARLFQAQLKDCVDEDEDPQVEADWRATLVATVELDGHLRLLAWTGITAVMIRITLPRKIPPDLSLIMHG